jgi:hypothetical protein
MDEIGRTVTVRERVEVEREIAADRFRLDAVHVNLQTREVSLEYHLGGADGSLVGRTRFVTLNPLVSPEGDVTDNWDSIVKGDSLDLGRVKDLLREVL